MIINNVEIEETYAEGFSLYGTRILITASTLELAKIAAEKATGFATSTIHCDSESGIDSVIPAEKTPDGRPGISVIFCVSNKKKMDEVLLNRIGQCVLTAPTTSCFDWFPDDVVSDKTFEVKTGFKLKFFGDGYEKKGKLQWNGKEINVWNIPTMDGDFVVQSTFKVTKIAGGGNFMVFGGDPLKTVDSCKKAIDKMMEVEGVVMPFPMGIVRSPSKMGSKYEFLTASTNHPLCPGLKETVSDSVVPDGAKSGYEFIINGFDKKRVDEAMKVGILELTQQEGIIKVTAGNYGGKLGKIFYNLKDILS